jgi:hypothetical protein
MMKHIRRSPTLSLLTAALFLSGASAATLGDQELRTVPFEVAELFFELNDTDGDLGIHAEIDGGPWTSLEIEGPGELKLLSIIGKSRLRAQGLTQLAFESAEPPFDELDPADFFRRFPEGKYEIEAIRQGGGTFASTVQLSHVLAAPPNHITVGGQPAADDCDADPLPEVDAPVLINWDPVTRSHPEIGRAGRVRISRYQLFVESETGKLSVDLPPSKTEYEVPFSAADRGQVFKFEIIARTTTGNNTAIESCFRLK